jgi:hypothetical protein
MGAVPSGVGFAGRAGAAPGRGGAAQRGAGRPRVQPGEGEHVGGAEQEGYEAQSEPGVAAAGLPKLAGRIKRRPERRGRTRPPPVCYEAVLKLDAELHAASKGLAGLRLQLGEALELLVRSNGPFELGYNSLASYARERCSQTGRWAEDTRAVAARLGSLPALRAALVTEEVNWSMAELVSRHATAGTDGELTEQAKRLTVRQMRERLGQSGRGDQNDEPAGGQQGDGAAGRQELDGEAGRQGLGGAAGRQETDAVPASQGLDGAASPFVATGGGSEFVTVELEGWPPFPYLDEVDPNAPSVTCASSTAGSSKSKAQRAG